MMGSMRPRPRGQKLDTSMTNRAKGSVITALAKGTQELQLPLAETKDPTSAPACSVPVPPFPELPPPLHAVGSSS